MWSFYSSDNRLPHTAEEKKITETQRAHVICSRETKIYKRNYVQTFHAAHRMSENWHEIRTHLYTDNKLNFLSNAFTSLTSTWRLHLCWVYWLHSIFHFTTVNQFKNSPKEIPNRLKKNENVFTLFRFEFSFKHFNSTEQNQNILIFFNRFGLS